MQDSKIKQLKELATLAMKALSDYECALDDGADDVGAPEAIMGCSRREMELVRLQGRYFQAGDYVRQAQHYVAKAKHIRL